MPNDALHKILVYTALFFLWISAIRTRVILEEIKEEMQIRCSKNKMKATSNENS